MSDASECCLCGEDARHDGTATFYAKRAEGGARVMSLQRVGVSLCDACAARVRGHWRARRLVGVGALGVFFGGSAVVIVAMSLIDLLPLRALLFVAMLTLAIVPMFVARSWLGDRRRELYEQVAERYDVDEIFAQLDDANGEEPNLSFELELGGGGSPRLETLAPALGRRRR